MTFMNRATTALVATAALLVFLSSTAAAQVPEFFYFQLNEGTGTSTADLASPGFGSPVATMTSDWDTSNPKLGFACMLDVAPPNGQVQSNTPWTTGGGDFTIETWFYDNTGNFQYAFGDTSASTFRCFAHGAAGVGSIILTGGGFTGTSIIGGSPLQTWTHLAWVYDSTAGTMTGYLNGALNVTNTQPVGMNLSGSNFQLNGYAGTPSLQGGLDEFRFWGQARTAAQITAFMNVELGASGFADDLACLSFDTPSSVGNCTALTANEIVNFTVINFGTNTINIGSTFSADLMINGSLFATENFTFLATNHPTYGSEQFAFATPVDMSAGGTFNMDVVLNYPGDQDPSNDTKNRVVNAGAVIDLACNSVNSPISVGNCNALSNAEMVSFTMTNLGAATLTIGSAFTADLIQDGTLVTTEAFTVVNSDVLCGGSATFTFNSTLDMTGGGIQAIDVKLTLGGDVDPNNDTATRMVNAGITDDLSAGNISAPVDATGCNVLTSTEVVTFDIISLGANPLFIGTSFMASLTHNGNPIATESFTVTTADIFCNGKATFSFATTLDLSAGGSQNIDVTLNYPGDVRATNDTSSLTVNASGPGGAFVNTFPYMEDFDTFGGPGFGTTIPVNNGWQQDTTETPGTYPNWYFGTITSSPNAGPETFGLGDHTSGSGRFGFIEDNASTNPAINLWSPCIDLTGTTNPVMRVWVNSHDYNGTNTHFNPVHLDLLTAGGVVTSIGSVLVDTGDQWVNITASMVPYIGQVVQAQIRGTNIPSTSFYCDSAIDDFSVYELVTLSGQAPQAGLATLDINGAINGNLNSVSTGDNGPYSASAASADFLNYSITGEAYAGILLLGGPLNVQVATFPGFGQFDIGLLPLNSMGLPGNLYVWADGITPPLAGFNQFFVLNGSGTADVIVGLPVLPVGTLTTFQCINTHSVLSAGFSNAVEISIF